VFSVHFRFRKKVRLKARERREKGSRENKRAKRRREVISEKRTNRSKGSSVGHHSPNTRHRKIIALGRPERAERGSRDRGSDVIAKVFRSRTELRLKNEEKNFELNADGEGKPMKLLCHKR